MKTGSAIFRNVKNLSIAQVVSMAAGVVSTAILARALGVENFGVIGFGTATLTFFAMAATLGTDLYGAREIAREHARANEVAGNILGLRIVLSALAFAGYCGLLFVLDLSVLERTALGVLGLGLFATGLTLDFLYQGLERMAVPGFRQVTAALLIMAGVVFFIKSPEHLVRAATVIIIATVISVIGVFVYTRQRVIPILPLFKLGPWRRVLASAVPMAISGTMNTIMFNTDTVMLGLMQNSQEVGLYTAAFKVLSVGLVPSGILFAAFFPQLSAAWGNKDRARERAASFARALLFVGPPISIAAAMFADDIVLILYGEKFIESVPILVILMGALFTMYLRMMFGPLLIAWNMERFHMKAMMVTASLNLVLNFALIPKYGAEGAAIASLASQIVITIIFAFIVHAKVGILHGKPLARSMISVGAALTVTLITLPFLNGEAWMSIPTIGLFVKSAIFGFVFVFVWYALQRFQKRTVF